jgi:hypothetical protein
MLVTGFAAIGCGDSDSGSAFGGLGETITRSDVQVYIAGAGTSNDTANSITSYTGMTNPVGNISDVGSASMTSGKLSFTLGPPTAGWDNLTTLGVTASPGDAQVLIITGFAYNNSDRLSYGDGTDKFVVYVYADKNVTLSGAGIDGQVRLAKGWNHGIYSDSANKFSSGGPETSYRWFTNSGS